MLLARLRLQCYTYRFYLNWAQVGYQQYSRTTVCHFNSVLPTYFDTQYCHVHVPVAQSEHIGSFQYLEYGLLLRLSLPFYKIKKQLTFMGKDRVQRV